MPLTQVDHESACEEKEHLVSHLSFHGSRKSHDSGFEDSTQWDDTIPHHRPRGLAFTFLVSLLRVLQQTARAVLHGLHSFNIFQSSTSPSLDFPKAKKKWNPRYILSFGRSFVVFLLPSFLQPLFDSSSDQKSARIHTTSWLDGIRGFAALFVFFYHFSQRIWASNDFAWGATQSGIEYTGFLRLPILRTLYAGPAAVSVFFVVSGFALSLKPVSQMLKGDTAGLLTTISSATLRRPLRLFLPCLAATFMDFVAVRTGMFAATRWVAQNPQILTGVKPPHIGLRGPFWTQFWDWLWEGLQMVDIFRWDLDRYGLFEDDYDKHLWTIPIEFRCSLILFLTQAALCNLSSFYRLCIQSLLCVLAQYAGRWDMLLFWGGGVLCELYTLWTQWQLRRNSLPFLSTSAVLETPTTPQGITLSRSHDRFQTLKSTTTTLLFLTSLYLISYPRLLGRETPGYKSLSSLLPSETREWATSHFFQGLGSFLLVGTVAFSATFTRFFSSALPRYLGKISFALYLVHGCLNHTLGYALLGWTYGFFGSGNGWSLIMRFTTALVLELAAVVWIADLFERTVGKATVSFGKLIEQGMSAKREN